MDLEYDHRYPMVEDLKKKAKSRIPGFAYDYLHEGCYDDISVKENITAIKSVKLKSELLRPFSSNIDMSVDIFGHKYSSPFGIAPVGLGGLMWPKSPEILAKAAFQANIPFVLSTVSSSSLEIIAEITQGKAWYQLYNPTDDKIRMDLLSRLEASRYSVMMVTVDVPNFGYRGRDIKNGLSMPPKMSLRNILQMLSCPSWLYHTILAGKPEMKTLKPYMPKNMPTDQLMDFMNKTCMGKVDSDSLKILRDKWKGHMVLKGILNEADVKRAISIGVDGIVVSNHGGRQLDNSQSPVETLKLISDKYGNKIKIIMDSGLNSGPDIGNALACGAHFTMLGRAFLYGVAAMGEKGASHTINILKTQLDQVMRQLHCSKIEDFPKHLVS
jgi:isopentenyl diphosphate isomerase/L-lactate dehydrogenase-like FMN-dependent dehydrogenase